MRIFKSLEEIEEYSIEKANLNIEIDGDTLYVIPEVIDRLLKLEGSLREGYRLYQMYTSWGVVKIKEARYVNSPLWKVLND